jgi:hypothetical protein
MSDDQKPFEPRDGGSATNAGAAATAEPPVDTYYDDEEAESCSRGWSVSGVGTVVCEATGAVRDTVLKAIPVQTTEHLVNSHNELLKAGVSLADAVMKRADSIVERARTLRQN